MRREDLVALVRRDHRPRRVTACSAHLEDALLRLTGRAAAIRQLGTSDLACQPFGAAYESACDRAASWFLEEVAS